MTEYKLEITKLECIPSKNKMKNIVSKVHWLYSGVDGKYIAQMEGFVDLELPENDFTNFNDLTEDMVKSWVLNKIEENRLQDYINKNIEAQKQKTVVVDAPWLKNTN